MLIAASNLPWGGFSKCYEVAVFCMQGLLAAVGGTMAKWKCSLSKYGHSVLIYERGTWHGGEALYGFVVLFFGA